MFTRVRRAAGAAARPAARQGPGSSSFIGPDVVVSGDVACTGEVRIDGRIEGNVRCEILVQGEGGTITGHIFADAAQLSGLVDGTVRARLVTLEPSARVTGDVTYETLSIAAGAAIEGRLARKEAAAAVTPAVPGPVPEAKPKRIARTVKAEEPGLLAVSGNGAAPAAAG